MRRSGSTGRSTPARPATLPAQEATLERPRHAPDAPVLIPGSAGQYGMGAEMGNSTQKLHARGPIGIRELCTYKYVVQGSGQARP